MKPAVAVNSDGVPLDKGACGMLAADGVQTVAVKVGEKLFTDRDYAVGEWPAELAGASFLRVPMNGSKTVCAAMARA